MLTYSQVVSIERKEMIEMKVQKSEWCSWCFINFGSAEPRRHRIVGTPDGGLEEKCYHFSCFHLLELREMIVKAAIKEKERRDKK